MLHNITSVLCRIGSNNDDKPVPGWVESSFPIIKIVLVCILLVLAVGMIVFVLMQKSESNGINAVTGQSQTFYNKNKGATLQGKIKILTIIDAVCILVICIIYLILNTIYEGFI